MSNERQIIAVRFHTPVNVGGFQPESEWFEDRPTHAAKPGQVRVRPGNPDLGEQRSSIVFEIRKGGKDGDIDVEVRESNLAEVQRRPPEQKPVTKR